jgi:16S rRNA (cytosine1402-N4)-methyltransferase
MSAEAEQGSAARPPHSNAGAAPPTHRRRPRYKGRNPRRFEEKYKELNPDSYPETVQKVLAAGKTPAGSHRPIMVGEVVTALDPKPGQTGVDCTLGYGGHALVLLDRIRPGGRLIGIDADPTQLPKAEFRLRAKGFCEEEFTGIRSNFAGLAAVLGKVGIPQVDFIFADLGVSSMQLDDPARGFTYKAEGPLDMRMNPNRGASAAELVQRSEPADLAAIFRENADEPRAAQIAESLAGRRLATTNALAQALAALLKGIPRDEIEAAKRRVFQALRIAVNEEFAVLDALLRGIPSCLKPGGRVAILTFHSGEDRRVKHAFAQGWRDGVYSEISREVTRPQPEEAGANPRSKAAKLRWAVRGRMEGSLE